jgi:amino acid adenylation domain-containing protein
MTNILEGDVTAGTGSGQIPVTELIEQQAQRTPSAIALRRAAQECSYAELLYRVERCARGLPALGVQPGDVVAIGGGRSIDTVVALLGVMRARAVALPLDAAQPQARARALVSQGQASLLIVTAGVFAGLGVTGCTEADLSQVEAKGNDGTAAPVSPDHPAYLVFTSGTTGRPRGVLGWHGALAHFVTWEQRTLRIGPGDRVAQTAALTFDATLKDLLPALIGGATVCLPPSDRPFDDIDGLVRWLGEDRITVLQTVPSILGAMVGSDAAESTGLAALRLICQSGEPLPGMLVARWRTAFPACPAQIVNLYGTTEATILKSWYPVPDDPGTGNLPVGWAIDGAELLVVNRRGKLCGVGELGEVLIRTPYLARPLPGRDDAPFFEVNPLQPDDPADLVQRTGDLGRYAPDGSVEITGRVDDQLKIRGVRVHPSEVTVALTQHPTVASAVVIPRRNHDAPDGEPELLAYVVAAPGARIDPAALRRDLAARLSAAAVPAHVTVLDALPVTAHGKVDRAALPAPREAQDQDDDAIVSETERMVASLWSDLFGQDVTSRNADFFALGGHSLLMVRMLARFRRTFQVELNLSAMFESPTVATLAAAVERATGSGGSPADGDDLVRPAPRDGWLPLTPEQEGLWFLQQLDPGSCAYNMAGAFTLPPGTSSERVTAAIDRVVDRHEALRTVYAEQAGRPKQRVVPPGPADVRVLTGAQDRRSACETLAAESSIPFDLAAGPVLRARLVPTPTELLLGLTIHHISCDGWSWDLISAELDALIVSGHEGDRPELPAPGLQYGDYAVWREQRENSATLLAAEEFWREMLGTPPPVLELPRSRPRPTEPVHGCAVHRVELNGAGFEQVDRFCREQCITPYMLTVAAFGLVLGRAANQEQIVLGMDNAGRDRSEIEEIVGFFIRTHALRLDLSGDPSFVDAVRRVKECMLTSAQHQELPFARLVEAVGVQHEPGITPVFQVLVRMPPAGLTTERPAVLEPVDLVAATNGARSAAPAAKFDLTLVARPGPGRLVLDVEYDTDLFDADFVAALSDRLLAVLADGPGNPDRLISDPGPEDVEPPFAHALPVQPQKRVGAELARTAKLDPDAAAIRSSSGTLTYRELAEAVRGAAAGIRPGEPVAIVGGKQPVTIAAVAGVIAAGGIAVPVDENLPPERRRRMLERAGVSSVLLTGSGTHPDGERAAASGQRVDLAGLRRAGTDVPEPEPADPEATAYIFFTSGTTGEPKAVAGRNIGLDHFIAWERAEFGIGPGDRVAQLTTLSFDAVLRDIFVPLTSGATLCLPPEQIHSDTRRLLGWLSAEGVTVVHTTPSVAASWLAVMRDSGGIDLSALRLVCLAGEPLTGRLVRDLRALTGNLAEVINLYGPTETTMIKSFLRVPADAADGPLPIGTPLPGTQIEVLGLGDHRCGPGERGKIVIRTPYRSVGYLRGTAAGLGARASGFVPNPWRDDPQDLLYCTGDNAVVLGDSSILVLGRQDALVKVNGVRIHPDEVAAALAEHVGVVAAHVEATVSGDAEAPSATALVAFAVRTPDSAADADELRSHLFGLLPAPVVPGRIVLVDQFPLLPNGKLDRRALISLNSTVPASTAPVRPSSPAEHQLLEIWQDLLGRTDFGVTDDFFALGGHSLLATVMITRIRKQVAADLTLRRLLRAPRIDELARVVSELSADADAEFSAVVLTLREPVAGSTNGLFLVHSIGGDVVSYQDLAARIPGNDAVHALRAPGLDGQDLFTDIQQMAAAYLYEIREIQPHGPYRLAGWSMGGVVAFELARQLSYDGEATSELILLDSYAPGTSAYAGFTGSEDDLLESFGRDLSHTTAPAAPPDLAVLLRPASSGEGEETFDLRRRFSVFSAHAAALTGYRLDGGHLAGTEVRLVLAGGQERPADATATLGWGELLGALVSVVTVPGADHFTLLRPPAVDAVAQAFAADDGAGP